MTLEKKLNKSKFYILRSYVELEESEKDIKLQGKNESFQACEVV